MKALISRLRCLEDPARDAVLLLLRVVIGAQFFISGKGKLAHPANPTAFFEKLHIPAPHFNALLVGGVEMIGGLLLIVGLATRLAAVPLTISMIVAYLTAHKHAVLNPDDATKGATGLGEFWKHVSAFLDQTPFPYLAVCLILLAFGPGRISIDHLIARKSSRR